MCNAHVGKILGFAQFSARACSITSCLISSRNCSFTTSGTYETLTASSPSAVESSSDAEEGGGSAENCDPTSTALEGCDLLCFTAITRAAAASSSACLISSVASAWVSTPRSTNRLIKLTVTFCEGVGFGTAETVAIVAEFDFVCEIGVGSAKGSETTSFLRFGCGFCSFLFFGAGESLLAD